MIKSRIKKIILALITIVVLTSTAYATDILNFPSKTVEKDKQWTINFNKQLKDENVKEYIHVFDKDNKEVNVDIKLGDEKKSVTVNPPKDGYTSDEKYTLVVEEGLRPLVGGKLKREGQLKFTIKGNKSFSSTIGELIHKDKYKYTATANVIVSPVMPMFKSLSITTSEKNIKKYKVEGNNNMFNIGENVVTVASKDKLEITFYDNNDKLIGKGILNVDKDGKNLPIEIK